MVVNEAQERAVGTQAGMYLSAGASVEASKKALKQAYHCPETNSYR